MSSHRVPAIKCVLAAPSHSEAQVGVRANSNRCANGHRRARSVAAPRAVHERERYASGRLDDTRGHDERRRRRRVVVWELRIFLLPHEHKLGRLAIWCRAVWQELGEDRPGLVVLFGRELRLEGSDLRARGRATVMSCVRAGWPEAGVRLTASSSTSTVQKA